MVVMGQVTVATQWINSNEPAFRLREMNRQAPDGTGWHRYQIISVVRDDRLAEYEEDLGPREGFSADEFEIPGGVWDPATGKGQILHTVAELQAYAAAHRQEGSFSQWYEHNRGEALPTSNLREGLSDHWEKKRTITKEKGI